MPECVEGTKTKQEIQLVDCFMTTRTFTTLNNDNKKSGKLFRAGINRSVHGEKANIYQLYDKLTGLIGKE